MLYLAEIKKQTKGFLPRTFKTELKLLAGQHNDQTWSAVQGEELILSDAIPQLGEGAMLMVNLSPTRQIQEQPELAGPELVRQLQKLSRLSEKLKEQQDEIERWKQSLTYQSEELSRRGIEVEAKLEQFEQMGQQIEDLERQRRELEQGWSRLQTERQQREENPFQLGDTSQLLPSQVEKIQRLANRLCTAEGGADSLGQQLNLVSEALRGQQEALNPYWQQLEQYRSRLVQRQEEVARQEEILALRQQEFQSAQTSLAQINSQLQIEQNTIASKRHLQQRLALELQTLEELQATTGHLDLDLEEPSLDLKVDLEALEDMPLGELQEQTHQLQADLDKLVQFVNDQEEELSLQSQAVKELEEQLVSAGEYDYLQIEEGLAEEQEKKRMLNRTLLGQRRNLKERQEILLQYLRILRRREGILELEESPRLNLEPLLLSLARWQAGIQEEWDRLESEIWQLQNSLQQIEQVLEEKEAEQARKAEELRLQAENLQQAKLGIAQLQSHLSLSETILPPLQDGLQAIERQLKNLGQWF